MEPDLIPIPMGKIEKKNYFNGGINDMNRHCDTQIKTCTTEDPQGSVEVLAKI